MIAAVTTTRDEADIIEASARCLLDQGVDLILAIDSSTDGTAEILRGLGAEVTLVDDEVHHQPYWMNQLAAEAHGRGAHWIIPWDADEFWFGLDQLNRLPENVATATLWHHLDWDRKVVPAEALPKVAFRWELGAVLANGNHDVSILGPRANVLEIRHWQFRGYEHFVRKVRERSRTLDPQARARGDGTHITRLDGSDDEQLQAAWAVLEARETLVDPIPCSR